LIETGQYAAVRVARGQQSRLAGPISFSASGSVRVLKLLQVFTRDSFGDVQARPVLEFAVGGAMPAIVADRIWYGDASRR
jgi:hypothetical protein